MPIIVLSAVGRRGRQGPALEAGADDYVTKPFGPRAGRAAGGGAAPGHARTEEPTIVAEGLEIDLAARGAPRRRGGPPDADRVLAAAGRWPGNRGRLMTHRALLVEVWGLEYADDFQVLRAHIANLRRKIEPPDGRATSAPTPASATASPPRRRHFTEVFMAAAFFDGDLETGVIAR